MKQTRLQHTWHWYARVVESAAVYSSEVCTVPDGTVVPVLIYIVTPSVIKDFRRRSVVA